jgi:hypothetical protein
MPGHPFAVGLPKGKTASFTFAGLDAASAPATSVTGTANR